MDYAESEDILKTRFNISLNQSMPTTVELPASHRICRKMLSIRDDSESKSSRNEHGTTICSCVVVGFCFPAQLRPREQCNALPFPPHFTDPPTSTSTVTGRTVRKSRNSTTTPRTRRKMDMDMVTDMVRLRARKARQATNTAKSISTTLGAGVVVPARIEPRTRRLRMQPTPLLSQLVEVQPQKAAAVMGLPAPLHRR